MSKGSSALAKAKAKEEITNTVHDLLKLKLTLPLGNPNLKLLHTNQCLFTELPSYMTLENFKVISQALTSTYTRYEGYDLNRWYIETTNIVNNGNDFHIEIELNPFASSLNKFKENKHSLHEAFLNALNNKNTTSSSTKGKVKSTKTKNVVGGEGKFIDNLTKKVVGKETDDLKKAKLIHKHLLKHLIYSRYSDSKFSSPEKAYKHKYLNCADTSRVTASMLRSAGVDCYVVHRPNHYYTVVKYNGKLYCTDAVGSSRPFNYYWKSSAQSKVKFKGKSSYSNKCGKNPCS